MTTKNAKAGGSGVWADANNWTEGSAPATTETWTIGVGLALTMNATPGALTGHGYITGGTLHITSQVAGTLGAITVANSGATRGVLDIAGLTTGTIGNIDLTTSDLTINNTGGTLGTIALTTSTLTFAGTAITAIIGAITATAGCTIYQNGIFTTGYTGSITIGGSGATLYASRSITNFLRVQGTITSNIANGVNYGVPVSDPISTATVGAGIEFVCASDNLASRGFVLGVANGISICGATRVQESTLAAQATLTSTSITIATNMALRAGTIAQAMQGLADIICIGHTPVTTNNGAQNDEIDIYLVKTYTDNGNGTWTIALDNVGAGQTTWAQGGTTPNWNDIHQTQREPGTPVYLMTNNVLFRGTDYNHRGALMFSGEYIASITNAALWFAYIFSSNASHAFSNTSMVAGFRHCASMNSGSVFANLPNTLYHFCPQSSALYDIENATALSCKIIGGATGITNCWNDPFDGYISGMSTAIDSSRYVRFSGTVLNCATGLNIILFCDNTGSGLVSGCVTAFNYVLPIKITGLTISNCTTPFNGCSIFSCSGLTITNCTKSFAYCTGELYGISWAGTDPSNTGFYDAADQLVSNNNQSGSGAYKAWMHGGTVLKATNVMPTGATYSYEHACTSATYPCFRQLIYTIKPLEVLHYRTWVRKTATMTYLPRIQIIDFFVDPLIDAVNNAAGLLAETPMTNSVDTWELIDCYYFNNTDVPKKVILRTLAMNATGTVYFYPMILNYNHIHMGMGDYDHLHFGI